MLQLVAVTLVGTVLLAHAFALQKISMGTLEYISTDVQMTYLPGRVVEHKSCHEYATHVAEPYNNRYMPRKSFFLPYPWTELPRALWRWEGPSITRAAFKAAHAEKPRCGCGHGCCRCSGCDQSFHYKIIGGRLWVEESCQPCQGRVKAAEEMIKVALYLFPLPDMEFLLHFGDGCGLGRPTINYSFCRNVSEGGFTMPSYGVWMASLGPSQMAAYHSCLWERYPAANRIPQAIWRGSSTNPEPVDERNYMRAARIRLHLLARSHPHLLDAKLVRVTSKLSLAVKALINDTGSAVQLEDYNQRAIILDLDGNGWSDRLGQFLIHFPTPLLKLASNISAFFEHVLAPGVHLDLFRPDMSDLVAAAAAAVADVAAHRERSRGFRQVLRRQRLARAIMDHVGLAEAMAYVLMVYKNATGFELDTSVVGFREVDLRCCNMTKLPREMQHAMAERAEALRRGGGEAGVTTARLRT